MFMPAHPIGGWSLFYFFETILQLAMYQKLGNLWKIHSDFFPVFPDIPAFEFTSEVGIDEHPNFPQVSF